MKKLGFALIIFTAILIGLYWIVVVLETRESEYATRREAEADGAFMRGWLPALLPLSSSNIHLRGDLDSNEVLIRFDFDPAELSPMTEHCKPIDLDSTSIAFVSMRKPSWWPDELRQGADLRKVFHLFCCATHFGRMHGARDNGPCMEYLAIPRTGNQAYFWCDP